MSSTVSISDQDFEQAALLIAVQEGLLEVMEDTGVTRSELARELGQSPANVTQVLSGERNLTLKTLSDVAFALGHRVEVTFRPIRRLS